MIVCLDGEPCQRDSIDVRAYGEGVMLSHCIPGLPCVSLEDDEGNSIKSVIIIYQSYTQVYIEMGVESFNNYIEESNYG